MLDPASLIALHTAMMWSFSAAFLLIRWVKCDWGLPMQWGIAFAAMPLVMLLEGHAERLNSDFGRILGFAVGFLGPALLLDGLRRFLKLPAHPAIWLSIFTIFIISITYFTVFQPSFIGRIVIFQFLTVGICFYLLHIIRYLPAEDHSLGRPFIRAFTGVPIGAFIAQSILVINAEGMSYNDSSVTLILLVATAIGIIAAIGCIILVAEQYAAHVGRQAGIDLLTNLPMRRTFSQKVDTALELFKTRGLNASVILFDIDHFKNINDTHGHDMGDRALQAVADCTRSLARPTDFVARLGGDEFAILLLNTNIDEATMVARRILEGLQMLSLVHEGAPIPLSGSFGVAQFEPGDATVHDPMKRADLALYSVKRRGRNDVAAHRLEFTPAPA